MIEALVTRFGKRGRPSHSHPRFLLSSTMASNSIAQLCGLCIQSFGQLGGLLLKPTAKFSDELSLIEVQDELGRFQVWAGNVGAHREGRVSLHHKLREASRIRGQVTELLAGLNEALLNGESDSPRAAVGFLTESSDCDRFGRERTRWRFDVVIGLRIHHLRRSFRGLSYHYRAPGTLLGSQSHHYLPLSVFDCLAQPYTSR